MSKLLLEKYITKAVRKALEEQARKAEKERARIEAEKQREIEQKLAQTVRDAEEALRVAREALEKVKPKLTHVYSSSYTVADYKRAHGWNSRNCHCNSYYAPDFTCNYCETYDKP